MFPKSGGKAVFPIIGMMSSERKSVAIVGGGISGLGAAYLLRDVAEVTLYERNDYIGGHSRTLEVEVEGKTVAVDTGFIVYNERSYPLLTRMFRELEVPTVESDMSFGVTIDEGWLEYSSGGVRGMFGDIRNCLNPRMWGIIQDILRFNRQALDYLEAPFSITLGTCLNEIGVGEAFKKYYLLPMGGSIWSCPIEQMLEFPAAAFIRFFNNHGLLSISDQPQWYSVRGGAREYVRRLLGAIRECLEIRPAASRILRESGKVRVTDVSGHTVIYDEVIVATHPEEALELVESAGKNESAVLSAFKYQPNEAVLHTDTSFMPRRRSAWASWVYRSDRRIDRRDSISLTYWMNNLQSLDTDVPVLVTLNPARDPKERCVLNRHIFHHPVFDQAAISAQSRIMDIQGQGHVWYCGAYQRNGFHEDGLWSADRVVKAMGVESAWT